MQFRGEEMRELETERLRLRRFRAGDAQSIFDNWANDPEVTRYLTWNPHGDVSVTEKFLEARLRAYEEPDYYGYGIERRSDGELMGALDVVGYHHGNPVIGYCLGRRFWGNGYMTEAVKALIEELKEDGYGTIVIKACDYNDRSKRVIEKCGFELVGTWEQPMSELKPEIVPVNSYRIFPEKRKSGGYTDENSETIDRWVDEGWEWGVPLSREKFRKAKDGEPELVLTPTKPVPREWLGDPGGKRVLGLASGGGQQMPVFAAMGAECWVLDFSERQIETEKLVAKREGYEIHAIRADMTKPLPFSDGFFDMIFHPVSNCYIREVEPVWRECARVLKKGGRLISGLDNGMNYLFSGDDEEHVVNSLPFDPIANEEQREQLLRDDCGMQFSHTLTEQIGGQLRAGLRLLDVYEDVNGSGYLSEKNIPCYWATLSEKE